MNQHERSARAYRLIGWYAQDIGDEGAEVSTMVSDILADLMHLCRHERLSFNARLSLARMHWEAER